MTYFKIFAFLLSLVSLPVLASEASGLFTVDMSKLFRSSDFGKNIISANNEARQELQNENIKLETELLSEEKNLSEQRKILSVDEFRPKALEFDKKVSIIRTEQSEKEKILKNKARKEESEFYKRIYPLLYQLLLNRGGSVLVDQRNVILWTSFSDITDDAIKLINQELDNSTQ
jgi:Skp family chaperone for outer membrane proteins